MKGPAGTGGRASSRRSASGRCSTICGAPCRRRPRSWRCWRAGPCRCRPRSSGRASSCSSSRCRRSCRSSRALLPRHAGITDAQPLRRARRRISSSRCAQTALLVAFLAHQAWLMIDAIGRTLFRLFVTQPASARVDHRGPVQEQPAHRLDRALRPDGGKPVASASLAALFVWCFGRAALPVAAALHRGLAVRAGDRPLGEPVARRCRQSVRFPRPMPSRFG